MFKLKENYQQLQKRITVEFQSFSQKRSLRLCSYPGHLWSTETFLLNKENILKLVKDIDTSETPRIDRLPESFLKNELLG